MRSKGVYDIRTGGRAPTRGRIDARSYPLRMIHVRLAGREESIYGYWTASAPIRASLKSPLRRGQVHM